MIKFLLLFITLFFSFNLRAEADLCDKEHLSGLKELAEQVEVNYEYIVDEDKDGDGEKTVNMYYVEVNLISDELYMSDGTNKYYFRDSEDGKVKLYLYKGNYEFFIHSRRCMDAELRTIRVFLPKFNVYSKRDECERLKGYDLDICDPWYQGNLDDVSFHNKIKSYLEKSPEVVEDSFFDKILDFLTKYIIYIVIGILLFGVIVLRIINYRRRSVLE